MGRGGRGLSIHIQPGPLDEPVSLEVYFPSVADVGDFDRSWRRAHHCSCKCEAKGGGTRGSDSPGDAQKKGLLRSVVDHLRNKVGHLPTEILWDFPRKHHEDPPPQYVTKLFVLDFNCQPLGRVPIFFMSVSTGIVAVDNSREVWHIFLKPSQKHEHWTGRVPSCRGWRPGGRWRLSPLLPRWGSSPAVHTPPPADKCFIEMVVRRKRKVAKIQIMNQTWFTLAARSCFWRTLLTRSMRPFHWEGGMWKGFMRGLGKRASMLLEWVLLSGLEWSMAQLRWPISTQMSTGNEMSKGFFSQVESISFPLKRKVFLFCIWSIFPCLREPLHKVSIWFWLCLCQNRKIFGLFHCYNIT